MDPTSSTIVRDYMKLFRGMVLLIALFTATILVLTVIFFSRSLQCVSNESRIVGEFSNTKCRESIGSVWFENRPLNRLEVVLHKICFPGKFVGRVDGVRADSDKFIENILEIPGIKNFHFRTISSEGLEKLPNETLETLEIYEDCSRLNSADFESLARFRNLKALYLSQLKSDELGRCGYLPNEIMVITKCKQLQTLSFSYVRSSTLQKMAFMKMSNLRSLHLYFIKRDTTGSLFPISSPKQLSSLTLSGELLGDDQLVFLSELTNLKELSLDVSALAGDALIEHFPDCDLQSICISSMDYSNLTEQGIQKLAKYQDSLESLVIKRTRAMYLPISFITGFKKLRYLNLDENVLNHNEITAAMPHVNVDITETVTGESLPPGERLWQPFFDKVPDQIATINRPLNLDISQFVGGITSDSFDYFLSDSPNTPIPARMQIESKTGMLSWIPQEGHSSGLQLVQIHVRDENFLSVNGFVKINVNTLNRRLRRTGWHAQLA